MVNTSKVQSLRLYRFERGNITCGAIFKRGRYGFYCVRAAPVVKWLEGKIAPAILPGMKRQGWRVNLIEEPLVAGEAAALLDRSPRT